MNKNNIRNIADDIITEEKIEQIKNFLNFSSEDELLLKNFYSRLNYDEFHDLVDSFYNHLLQFSYPKSFFENKELLNEIKTKQIENFKVFLTSSHDINFFKNRRQIAEKHEEIDLDNSWYVASYGIIFNNFYNMIMKTISNPKEASNTFLSFSKLMFLDIGIVVSSYIKKREKFILTQKEKISELSSPEFWGRERLRVIGQLSAGIAHDFNNFL